jgi:hypothetical protein
VPITFPASYLSIKKYLGEEVTLLDDILICSDRFFISQELAKINNLENANFQIIKIGGDVPGTIAKASR